VTLPRRLSIAGHIIQVRRVKELSSDCRCDGRWIPTKNLIEIQCPDTDNWSPSYTKHVLWHEITHALLEAAGKPDLSSDEDFVDSFAGLLMQAVETLK